MVVYETAALALILSVANLAPGRRAVSVIFDKLPPAISLHFSPFSFNQTFLF